MGTDVRSSTQVKAEARTTYRKLDYWAARGVFGEHLQAVGSGNPRRFSTEDLAVVAVIERVSKRFQGLAGTSGGIGSVQFFKRVADAVRPALAAHQLVAVVDLGDGMRFEIDLTTPAAT